MIIFALLTALIISTIPVGALTSTQPDTSSGAALLGPVKTTPALTSSFCEFRARHFHAGIDAKTYGQIGVPCVAVADGRITRIKVTPGGYGKALYLDFGGGLVAVYAHLDRFVPLLTDILHREQERTSKYTQDIFLEGDQAPRFRRGEIVAYSGRSGTVHPHLHFELRKGWDQAINPLTNGYKAEDTIPPTPTDLAVTPLDASSTVEMDCQPRLYERLMRHHDGVWRVGEPIGVNGRVGLSLDAYDRANSAENVLSAYRFELFVNGQSRWITQYDEFNYEDTRQIEVERDYRLWRNQKGAYHRLYRASGNRLDSIVFGDGVIVGRDSADFPIEVRILVSDAAGNQSVVELTLVSDRIEDEMRAVVGRPLWNGNGSSPRS
ncbi:MAG: M23 family metallopeptidase, partial [Calditrichota bacterium]